MKKLSILLLLMAFFAPLAMNAQSTQDWGSSSTYSGTDNNANPFGRYYGYEYRVYLYPPNTMPFSGNITQLEFLPNGTLSAGGQIDVWMKTTTTITSLDISNSFATYKSGATQVYTSSSSPAFTSGTYVAIPLSTPIAYNYSNNEYLMILVRSEANSTSGDGGKSFFYYNPTNASNNTWWAKNDYSDPGESAAPSNFGAKGTGAYLPVVRFTYTGTAVPTISLSPSSATVFTGFTTTLTATCGNVSGTPSINYSSSNTTVATVTGSGTTATVTGVAPGTATITATMTVSGSTYTATSNIIVENPSYCTPAPTSIDGSGITNVTFGTVNDNLTMNSSPYYYDHSNVIGVTTSGSTVNMSIAYATNYTYYTWVWVDWNKDYVFDDTDLVYPSTQTISSGTLSLQFVVPSTVTAGDYRMRIQGADGSSKKNPCYTGSYSYLVDYTLRVSSDPTISLTPATATVLAGSTETITATVTNVSGTPSISYSSSNTGIAMVTGSGTTATVTGVSVGTATITATMTVNGTPYTATCTVNVADLTTCQGFETDLGFWTVTTDNANYTWERKAGTGASSYSSTGSGSYNVGVYYGGRASSYTYLTLNADLSSYTEKTISFMYINPSWGSDTDYLYLQYTTDGTTYTDLVSYTSGTTSWTQVTNLAIPDAAKYIRFAAYSNYGYGVGLDEICLDYEEPSSCPKPKDLVVSDITSNSAKLAWTPGGSETSWEYLCIAHGDTPDWTSQHVITSFTHSNVPANILAGTGQDPQPETEYDFYVRAVCGGGDYSTPAMITFTTEAACPAPTGLTVSDITPNSANVSWSGEADSYELEYAVVTSAASTEYTYDFESGNLDGWTNLIVESAGGQWLHSNNNPAGYDYTGRAHGGTGFALSFSFVDNPDAKFDPGRYNTNVYLVSPQSYQIATGASLNFWYNYANSSYPDNMEVCVATVANPTASDFTSIWNSSTVTDWASAEVSLNTYAGQTIWIAFHHEDYDMYEVWVDDITVNVGSSTNLTWMPAENPLTGLTPETTYAVRVRGNCGTDGYSQWTNAEIFPTLSACVAPTGLTSELNGNAATLGWDGYQDSYQVRYSKAFYEGFENGIPATWTTIDADGDGHNWFALSEISTAYPNGNYPELSGWAHSGSNAATSASFVNNYGSLNANDWLITPLLDLYGTLTFYVASTYTPDLDSYEVLLSTTGTSVSDFNVTLKEMTTASYYVSNWDEVSIDLSSYEGQQGYIAIHHVSSNMYFLVVDDFSVSADWTTINASEATAIINGLSSQQMYEWQVQGAGCDNWSASATFTTPEFYTKTIEPYTSDGGYYLIASPLANNVAPTDVLGMITDNLGANVDETTSTYDLYSFDQAQELEWRNYRANTFELVNGQGYLYASKEGTELVFTGAGNTGNTQDVTLYMTDADTGLDFPDWNLVGNPFAKDNAYLSDGRAFYSMQNSGVYTPQLGPVAIRPMEGVFVVANSNEENLTFTTTQPNSKVAQLTLNLTKSASAGSTLLDRAIVRFDEGSQLPKLQFRNGSTKVYIPLEGKDYAVVRSEAMGTMPVNFKAEKSGSYTLSFTSEEVSFSYLHLIDNMTGNDVDLLKTPSYSFEAKTTDYESRFKLVFATGNSNDDTFAFYTNGSFVINNEGNATLQVIDVNGRILKSESINGCANVNVKAAQGVYMLRLVNGNDVKVQKVVVR